MQAILICKLYKTRQAVVMQYRPAQCFGKRVNRRTPLAGGYRFILRIFPIGNIAGELVKNVSSTKTTARRVLLFNIFCSSF